MVGVVAHEDDWSLKGWTIVLRFALGLLRFVFPFILILLGLLLLNMRSEALLDKRADLGYAFCLVRAPSERSIKLVDDQADRLGTGLITSFAEVGICRKRVS